jgi:dUTP pyrophosphatase
MYDEFNKVMLGVYREHPDAKLPEVAYGGTSAAFDLYAVEDTVIPANGNAMVPVGVRLTIPKGYYVEFATRSGHGIGKNLRVHPGIIDHGYSGEWSVKMFNMGDKPQTIEKGKATVQCKLHKIPPLMLFEIDEDKFEDYRQSSLRGDNGFGSSDKK